MDKSIESDHITEEAKSTSHGLSHCQGIGISSEGRLLEIVKMSLVFLPEWPRFHQGEAFFRMIAGISLRIHPQILILYKTHKRTRTASVFPKLFEIKVILLRSRFSTGASIVRRAA